VHTLLVHGYLGVYVFFALSGFVIACSLRGVRIDAGVVGRFALKRSLRLDPAYWVTIALTVIVFTVASQSGRLSSKGLFTVGDVLANMFYLNKLLGYRAVVSVGWTLCLEIQLYVAFVLLGWAAWALGGRAIRPRVRLVIFAIPTIASLLVFAGVWPIDQPGLCVGYWFMCFLGVVVWWTLSGKVSRLWLWSTVAACAATALYASSVEAAIAIATALAIYAAARMDLLDSLLRIPVLHISGGFLTASISSIRWSATTLCGCCNESFCAGRGPRLAELHQPSDKIRMVGDFWELCFNVSRDVVAIRREGLELFGRRRRVVENRCANRR
jgi:hypothetical protein